MTFASLTGNVAAVVRTLPFILAFGAVSSAQASSPATLEARNEAIVRKAFEGWAAGQSNVFDLLSPDVLWTIRGSGPVAGTYRGVEDFVQRASRPLISRLATPLKPQIHYIWAKGDRVIIRFAASATTTSGASYNNQFVWIFRMEDSSVTEAEAFLDLVAYQQVVDNNEPRQQR